MEQMEIPAFRTQGVPWIRLHILIQTESMMQLFLGILTLCLISCSAIADWNLLNAKPQPFSSPEGKNYVIAIGTNDNLEIVEASDIEKALTEGKAIRLLNVKVEGNIRFVGSIVKNSIHIINSSFNGEGDFRGSTFDRGASLDFQRDTFNQDADFRGCTFKGNTFFSSAIFKGGAFFGGSTFTRTANFSGCYFNKDVYFTSSTFSEGAIFSLSTFNRDTYFNVKIFKGIIHFDRVSGFYKMWIYWDNSQYGIKRHLHYDETFYIALIKNYRDMGWLDQADDAYYTYRKEKRIRRYNSWARVAEQIFLEETFGYGVKPLIFLCFFSFLWIAPGLYYSIFLRCRIRYRNWFSSLIHDKLRRIPYGLLYSLDTLTPGIEFDSLLSLKKAYTIWTGNQDG
ncbi:hypothetical protein GF312_14015 [Candidatus Poribacteria bacterium]|nr:hypothetical protein [Candidatus Poribacteria bacterium]